MTKESLSLPLVHVPPHKVRLAELLPCQVQFLEQLGDAQEQIVVIATVSAEFIARPAYAPTEAENLRASNPRTSRLLMRTGKPRSSRTATAKAR